MIDWSGGSDAQLLFQKWKKYQVGRQPVYGRQIIRSEPLCGLVLFKFQLAGQDAAPVAVHSKMKRRIVILDRGNETVNANFGLKFLHNLTPESLLHSLARLSLPPWQFPPVFELAIPTLGNENLSFAIADHRRNYCNTLHNGCKDKQSFTAAQVGPNRHRLVQPPLLFDDLVGLVDFLELFFGTVLLFAAG